MKLTLPTLLYATLMIALAVVAALNFVATLWAVFALGWAVAGYEIATPYAKRFVADMRYQGVWRWFVVAAVVLAYMVVR